MTVIPGLSRPLKAVGKPVGGWNEGDDRLWVTRAVLFDRRLVLSELLASQLPSAWVLPTPVGIEVLGGREATIVAGWLRQHPTVEIVARDRAGAYSDAARTASPGAQQVADRWHLLTNLREAVERLLVRRAASLREAARMLSKALRIEAQPITADARATVLQLNVWQRLGIHRRAARLARYEEVMRRRQLGESYKAIGRAMNLDQRTVSKFVGAARFLSERRARAVRPCSTDIGNTWLHAPPRAASVLRMSGMSCKLEASPGASARFAARWRGLTPAASEGGARPATRSGACPSSRRGLCVADRLERQKNGRAKEQRPTALHRNVGTHRTGDRRCGQSGTSLSWPDPPSRRQWLRSLAGQGQRLRGARAAAIRGGPQSRFAGGARGLHVAVQQRPGRGASQSTQVSQAADVRTRQARLAARACSPSKLNTDVT